MTLTGRLAPLCPPANLRTCPCLALCKAYCVIMSPAVHRYAGELGYSPGYFVLLAIPIIAILAAFMVCTSSVCVHWLSTAKTKG